MSYVSVKCSQNEKMLWLAVLRRAVFDYVLYNGSGHHRYEWQKAYQYIFVELQDYENGFSFEQVCDFFNWDPEYIRGLTKRLTRADIKKMEHGTAREDLNFQDKLALYSEISNRWTSAKASVPRFPPYNFPHELRKDFSPELVYRHSTKTVFVPLINWAIA
jgi:hypothetical protein